MDEGKAMKEPFEPIEIEIIVFEDEDIITGASNETEILEGIGQPESRV